MKALKELINKSDELTRRAFATRAAQAMMGVSIGTVLSRSALAVDPRIQAKIDAAQSGDNTASTGGSSRTAKSVIYFYMSGGMSHLDTFDPHPGASTQGATKTISTAADGVTISEYFPKLAKQMNHVALVRSLTSTQGAHEQGNYLMHTSYNPRGTIKHPALGAWAVKMKGKINETLPGFVLVGGGGRSVTSGFFDNKYGPAPVGNPRIGLQNSNLAFSESEFNERLKLADAFDRSFRSKYRQKQVESYTDLYKEAIDLLKGEDIKAFDIREEKENVFQSYGNNYIGQASILARRLVEKGVRFIEIDYGGWDNHNDIFQSIGQRCNQLDQAMGALIEDLSSRGLLSSTLIAVGTEFGRTPHINERRGRDHHPAAFSGLLAGAGIKGGQFYGKTDELGRRVAENPVKIPDYNATIATAMGLNVDQVVYSPTKRPFQVANKDGKPIQELLNV